MKKLQKLSDSIRNFIRYDRAMHDDLYNLRDSLNEYSGAHQEKTRLYERAKHTKDKKEHEEIKRKYIKINKAEKKYFSNLKKDYTKFKDKVKKMVKSF